MALDAFYCSKSVTSVINGRSSMAVNFLFSVLLCSPSNQLSWPAAVHKAPFGRAAVTPPVTDCIQVRIPEAPTQCLLPETLCQGFTRALQPPPCSQPQQQGPGPEMALAAAGPRSLFQFALAFTTGLEMTLWLWNSLTCCLLIYKLLSFISRPA